MAQVEKVQSKNTTLCDVPAPAPLPLASVSVENFTYSEIVFLLFPEKSALERIGYVTGVTLMTLLTVPGCTDKDKFCRVDLAGPTDQIKQTSFRCQIIDNLGPVAISPGYSLAEEF